MLDVKDLAHEGKAIGVDAARGQRDHDVAGAHGRLIEDLRLVDDAHGKAREVVLVRGVEARHLRCLAADERRAALHAALGHAADDLGDALGDVLAAGDVVQKQQGLRAAADDVVDAHGHAVDADGVVLVHEEGELQLRADAVRAADEHGVLDAGRVQLKQTAEAADVGTDARGHSARDVAFHQLNGPVSGGDVHPGGRVALRAGIMIHGKYPCLSKFFLQNGSCASRWGFPWDRPRRSTPYSSPCR